MKDGVIIYPTNISIPKEIGYDKDLDSEAVKAISRLDVCLEVSLIDYSFDLFYKREAETSSRIEGTVVEFEDVVLNQEKEDKDVGSSEILEALGVSHAIQTMNKNVEQGIPIGERFLKDMHRTLMKYAKRDAGALGEFRNVEVRIGSRYTPPKHQDVERLFTDFEKYIHEKDARFSPMVKIGILHAYFELIHPFRDGNGRIGRLLISLLMKEYGYTKHVSFFISPYLEKNRSEYYYALENITKKGDWEGWINFFLLAVYDHSKHLEAKLISLHELYKNPDFLKFSGKSSQAIKNYLFKSPVFTVPNMLKYFETEKLEIKNKVNLHTILRSSSDISVLIEGAGKRKTLYACKKVLELIKE